jgi:hypothetical protein
VQDIYPHLLPLLYLLLCWLVLLLALWLLQHLLLLLQWWLLQLLRMGQHWCQQWYRRCSLLIIIIKLPN